LFCTTYVAPNGIEASDKPLDEKIQKTLERISKLVVMLLEECLKVGKVYIITNAIHGWVEYSIKKYMPKAARILEKVRVISARAEFEDAFPDQVDQWKMHAYLEVKNNTDILTNIIAIGDANRDLLAAHHLAGYFLLLICSGYKSFLIKTVKCKENPDPLEMVRQLEMLIKKFPQIHSSFKNLSIKLERYNSIKRVRK